jgi:DNA-binding transcriptional regulator YdaS (Cro superfamily)
MILRVTLADCAAKIEDSLEGRITHEELQQWSRDAMLAIEIPPQEHEELMALLQDMSVSTRETLRMAIKHYKAFTSPLTKGLPKSWL